MNTKKLVYKFRCWDNPHHQRILTHNEIYFASPRNFNDPFDCAIPISYDLMPKNKLFLVAQRVAREIHPDWSPDAIDKEASLSIGRGDWGYKGIEQRRIKDELDEYFGAFSLAGNRSNILLWSHYANKHRGFCVGYDRDKLWCFAENQCNKYNITFSEGEIDYCTKFPDLIPEGTDDIDVFQRQLFIKSMHWSYEEEFRLLLMDVQNVGKRAFPLDDEMVSEIILGCMMPEQHKASIIQTIKLRKPKPLLLQAKMKLNEFGLDFDRIDY